MVEEGKDNNAATMICTAYEQLIAAFAQTMLDLSIKGEVDPKHETEYKAAISKVNVIRKKYGSLAGGR